MRGRALIGSALTFAVAACATTPRPHARLQEEALVLAPVSADDAGASTSDDRAIIDELESLDGYYHGGWKISLEDAERADSGVRAYLESERPELALKLDDYVAQVFGTNAKEDRPLIHFNFICKRALDENERAAAAHPEAAMPDWRKQVILVNDGGDCYFGLDFDPKTGTYESLIVNGQA